MSSSESSDSSAVKNEDAAWAEARREALEKERALSRMNLRAAEITRRVGISAPLDASETTDPITGIDAIRELEESGLIVPATLEEVEAALALAAAALTPEADDDQAALILKHRGSYRFFLNE